MKKQSTVLRERLQRGDILFRPGVAIAIHAKMAEALGFEAVGVSGANTATHVLGLPDAGLITMTELVENVRRIVNVTSIPVIADCDTGFGNAIAVRRTVQEMIAAGAAGLFIEDQVAPKRCGFVKGKELVSLEEAVGKFGAALDARDERDSDCVIMARTDARTAFGGGMAEVIRRAKAYRATGVDVIYVEALQSREEVAAVRSAISGLLTCSCNAIRPHPTLQEMQDMGLCMTMGTMFFKSGLVAMWDLLVEMKERGLGPYTDFMERTHDHPLGGLNAFDLTGFPKIAQWEEKYLPPEQLARYEGSLGLYDPRDGGHKEVRIEDQ